MKRLFRVSVAAVVFPLVASVTGVIGAEYPQLAQAAPRTAEQSPANSPSAEASAAAQKEKAARIDANLAKLSDEDRQLAEAQGYCAIMVKNPLGAMGPPVKVMIKNQPVILCCEGCQKKALADPKRTLATVEQLKSKVAEAEISASLAKLSEEDRKLAQTQGYCPVMKDNRLGVMGTPLKVSVNNQPVLLCCAGCKRRALCRPGPDARNRGESHGQSGRRSSAQGEIGETKRGLSNRRRRRKFQKTQFSFFKEILHAYALDNCSCGAVSVGSRCLDWVWKIGSGQQGRFWP